MGWGGRSADSRDAERGGFRLRRVSRFSVLGEGDRAYAGGGSTWYGGGGSRCLLGESCRESKFISACTALSWKRRSRSLKRHGRLAIGSKWAAGCSAWDIFVEFWSLVEAGRDWEMRKGRQVRAVWGAAR